MKKHIISAIVTISLTNLTTHTMDQALVCSDRFDKLPKHELNIIASFTKRPGKDTLRCVNKTLNAKIISQDDLYARYENAKLHKDPRTIQALLEYNTFVIPNMHHVDIEAFLRYNIYKIPNLHSELINAIKDNNIPLAIYCLNRLPRFMGHFQHNCINIATSNGNIDMVKILLPRRDDKMQNTLKQNHHVANVAAKNKRPLDIVRVFEEII